jgi:hypothetical protein
MSVPRTEDGGMFRVCLLTGGPRMHARARVTIIAKLLIHVY